MLYTIAVILVVLWLLGLVTSYTMGGLIHVLLVVAVITTVSIERSFTPTSVPPLLLPSDAVCIQEIVFLP